jgi:hypothetical protein
MLKSFFGSRFQVFKDSRLQDYQKCYFQQDGASHHKAALVQTWLTEKFGDKFIAKNE